MSEIEELYENFPTILKEKLRNKEIEFSPNTYNKKMQKNQEIKF